MPLPGAAVPCSGDGGHAHRVHSFRAQVGLAKSCQAQVSSSHIPQLPIRNFTCLSIHYLCPQEPSHPDSFEDQGPLCERSLLSEPGGCPAAGLNARLPGACLRDLGYRLTDSAAGLLPWDTGCLAFYPCIALTP